MKYSGDLFRDSAPRSKLARKIIATKNSKIATVFWIITTAIFANNITAITGVFWCGGNEVKYKIIEAKIYCCTMRKTDAFNVMQCFQRNCLCNVSSTYCILLIFTLTTLVLTILVGVPFGLY